MTSWQESLAGGSTLAEIADEQGIATDTLIDAALTGLDEKLDALMADGRLTQERADEIRDGSRGDARSDDQRRDARVWQLPVPPR